MVSAGKELKIRYTADTAGVSKGLGTLEKQHATLGDKLKSVGSTMTSVGKTATIGLTLPIVAFGKTAIDSFTEASQVAAQTDAVLKSTGGAAGVTAEHVGALSDRIGKLAAVDNDAVQAGANLLLTFKGVRNEAGKGNAIFDQTLKLSADVAAAMGTDTKSAALQLGKALNDPAAGLSKLSRMGVTFTEQQKEQVAALVEAGDTMGAQKIILGELNSEFGGSAKAAGKTASPITKLGLIMDDLGETVGAVIVPLLSKLAGWLQRAASWFQNLSPGVRDIAVKIALVAAAVGPLLIVGGKLVALIGMISKAFTALATMNPWVLVIAGAVALVVLIIAKWDTIKKIVLAVWEKIKSVGIAVWRAIKGVVLGVWNAIKTAIRVAWNVIKTIAKAYFTVWRTIFLAVKVVALTVWNAIKSVIRTAAAVIKGIAQAIKGVFVGVWNAIKSVAVTVWNGIKDVVGGAWERLKVIGRSIAEFFKGVWRGIKEAAVSVWNGIKDVIGNVWDGIVAIAKSAINALISILNGVIRGLNVVVRGINIINPGPDVPAIPEIPSLARGGRLIAGGLAWVGERGPELVKLPRGADVYSNPDSRRMAAGLGGGATVVINVAGSVVTERDLATCVRDELLRLQRRNGYRSGVT